MTNILLVDDDEVFRLSIGEGLTYLMPDSQIITASNGEEAIEVLKAKDIHLVITDVKMPVMDGFELMAYLSRKFSTIPVIVITAYGTPEIERIMEQYSAFQYMEKPLDIDLLTEKIKLGLEAMADGYLTGIPLPSFLQLVALEGKTCTIKIVSGQQSGFLYFSTGVLLDAQAGIKVGTLAAFDILSWDRVEISIDNKCDKKEKKIDQSLDYLILESYRQKDEVGMATNQDEEEFAFGDELDIEIMSDIESRPPLDELLEERDDESQNLQEERMDVSKLNEAIETLRASLGDGLLATDIFSASDGQSLIGYNTNDAACALFNQVTDQLNKVMMSSGFPEIGKYYLIDLADDKMVLNIPLGEYQWLMLLHGADVKLGLLLNVVLPDILDAFEESLAG
jgi:CheY-like chemotaxis protein